jgi:hypothetical protein
MDPLISALRHAFEEQDIRSRRLLSALSDEQIYLQPRPTRGSMVPFSCGEYILRSAAMVEQAFGGITTRLWDDPFEWTLPEKLANRDLILGYLDEVAATREKGLEFIGSADDLTREMPAPRELRSLAAVLIDALTMAEHYQGRAFGVFQVVSDAKVPRW